MGFGKGVTAVLDLKDKILSIYYLEDLQELQVIQNLNDEWFLASINGIEYDWNVYYDGKIHKLTMYEVEDTIDGYVTNTNSFVDITLNFED